MKIGKLLIKSGYRKVLLGLAVAGALLFASCENPFNPPAQEPQESESGYGTVRVLFGEEEARTLFPGLPITNGVIVDNNFIKVLKFDFVDHVTGGSKLTKFVVPGDTTWNGKFNVPEGDYTIEVRGYSAYSNDNTTPALNAWIVYGENEVSVVDQFEVAVTIGLMPIEKTTKAGIFIIKVKYNDTGSSGTVGTPGYDPGDGVGIANVTLEKIGESGSREVVWSYVQSLTSGTSYDSSLAASGAGSGFGAASNGTGPLTKLDAGGDYLFTFRLNTSLGKYYGYTEAVHITNGVPTTFDRTGNDPNSITRAITRVDLATMDADEAKALLVRDIASWNAAANVISGKAATVVADVDTSTADEITVSYFWYKFANPGIAINPFLTNLQGGWTTSGTWDVSGTDLKTLVLKNDSVGIDAFTVKLQPVTKFNVAYHSTVTDKTGRTVTIGATAFNDDGATGLIKITSAAASVDVVLSAKVAITINDTEAVGDATGKYTLSNPAAGNNLKLESRVYNVTVYKSADEQVTDAFDTLRAALVDKSWIVQKEALAFGGVAPDETRVWYKHNDSSGTDLKTKYNTEIYYVATRGSTTLTDFRISLPQIDEPRWKMYGETWTLDTARAQAKKVYFDPTGGAKMAYYYTVTLVPVAEYTVTFRKGPNGDDLPTQGGIKVTNIPLVPGTSATPADNNIGFAQSGYKFIGGVDTGLSIGAVAGVDPAKTVTITDQSSTDKLIITIGRTLATGGLSVSVTGDPDDKKVLSLASTLGAQTDSYLGTSLLALASKEYKIDVFPSIKNQKEQYLKRFYAVTQAELVGTKSSTTGWWSGSAGFIKYTPDNLKEDWRDFTKPNLTGDIPTGATTGEAPATSILYRGANVVTAGQIPGNSAAVTGNSPAPAYNFLKGTDFAHYALVPDAVLDNVDTEAVALGVSKYGFRWRPIGAKIPSANPTPYPTVPTAGSEDYQDYVIKLISFARYNVVFRTGPNSVDIANTDGIKITNITPGTKAKSSTTPDITVSKGDDSKTFIGGTYASSLSMTDKVTIQDKTNTAAKSKLIVALYDGVTTLVPTPGSSSSYKESIENVASVASQEYTIFVYPSIAEQQKQIKRKLGTAALWDITGGGVSGNNWFTGGPSDVSGYVNATLPTLGTDGVPTTLSTEVWYVLGSSTAVTAVQPKPDSTFLPSFTNDGYVSISSASTADSLVATAKGVKLAALQWTPLGGTAGTADTDAARADSVYYTFKLVAVARYDVAYMKGPAGVVADGGIIIETFRPGTNGVDDAAGPAGGNKVSLNTGTSPLRYLYGASGADVTATLKRANSNVIMQDSAVTDTFVTSDASANDISLANASPGAVSKKYSIKVYPTLEAQVTEARLKMSVQDPIDWITAPTTTSIEYKLGRVIDVGSVGGSAAGQSTVYYFGTAPTFDLPTAFSNTTTGFNSDVVYWTLSSGNIIQLTPVVSGSQGAQTVWTFNKTPVDKYNVQYSSGATGAVAVTPYIPTNSTSVDFAFARKGSITGLKQLSFNSTNAGNNGVDGPAYASRIATNGTLVTVDMPYKYTLMVRDASGDIVAELRDGSQSVFTGKKTLIIPVGQATNGDEYSISLTRIPD